VSGRVDPHEQAAVLAGAHDHPFVHHHGTAPEHRHLALHRLVGEQRADAFDQVALCRRHRGSSLLLVSTLSPSRAEVEAEH
jgi:hypothetical protein